ncbi:hypothetical protein [Zunongwangia sp. H14]|uniref:hypothetical protein n=1 Tax=Zunongwangia sp. H14 TaxID=3240792 RepID=UPI003564141F
MKRVLSLFFFISLIIPTGNAQEFKAGANTGFPFGSDGQNFYLLTGVDLSYTFHIFGNIELGGITGYGRFFGKDNEGVDRETYRYEGVDFNYIPLAVTAKYALGHFYKWFGGVDAGYAFALGDEKIRKLAGFYYALKGGWQNDNVEIFAYYQGIGNSETKSKTSGNFTTSTTFAKLGAAGVGIFYKF